MNEIRPDQSIELLKELHILTREGRLNQDSRRKLKQVNHLFNFIKPLLLESGKEVCLVDHGAGKSYLGFIINDLFYKNSDSRAQFIGIETREDLVKKSKDLASKIGFANMQFYALSVADSIISPLIPNKVDIVTALHACDTATDDAINFAIRKEAKHIVLVPCCQAEVASILRKNKHKSLSETVLSEIWRHPIHTREFGSHLTNVLRCLQLESFGYQVTVTELVGWEHSMKNELIIASKKSESNAAAKKKLIGILNQLGLSELDGRFFTQIS